jgi:serine protease AprX
LINIVPRRLFHHRLARTTLLTALLVATAAAPAFAEHRARLSGDLASHLAAGSPSIDVIVEGGSATVDAIAARYNLVVKKRLKSGAVLQVTAGQLDALQRDGDVDKLSGDVKIRSSMAVTNEAIGADQVWAGHPGVPALSGKGVAVAVLDSGISSTHQAVKGRVIASVDFTGGDGVDRFGHGTHVAGIIAGQAGRTADTQHLQGVAAGAYLVSLRVLGDDGSGTVSNVIEAIDWAIDHQKQYSIGVLNLSLGAPVLQPYRDDPLCKAVERAVAAGIVVVASAGNFGKTADGRVVFGGITSPGNDPYVMTVGAVDTHATAARSDDTVASYSSRGPTRYDMVVKPDLVAPGSHIVSAEAAGSYLSRTLPERHVSGTGTSAYIQLSGTSMAAGVVSGAAALLLQEKSWLTPADAKAVLQLSSTFLATGLLTSGAGSLNALAAANYVQHPSTTLTTTIAAEQVTASEIFFVPAGGGQTVQASSARGNGGVNGQTLVTGQNDSIIWGSSDSIIWGNSDSIIWGSSDSIIWGSSDSIIWGSSDSIIWANSDSIIWGS